MSIQFPKLVEPDKVRELLDYLHTKEFCLYHSLFKENRETEIPGTIDLKPLLDANLVEMRDGKFQSPFRIAKVCDLFIVTDSPSYFGSDRVWYLLEDESLLFARRVPQLNGLRALDIATGSGVLALVAAKNGASEVVAVDVSPRSIRIGEFNAGLNQITNVRFVQAGVEDFEAGGAFDYISFNPPFVPMPDNIIYVTSGAGGRDGLAVVYGFWKRIGELTHDRTQIDIISMSPGDDCVSALEKLFIRQYRKARIAIRSIDIYGDVAPIDVAFKPFAGEASFKEWKEYLATQEFTHMHYLFISAFPSDQFSFSRQALSPRLEDEPESGTWRAMYAVIQNSKEHAQGAR